MISEKLRNNTMKREFGADFVRVAAVCLLFWLHFYLRNGFYNIPVNDAASFIANMFRPLFMTCVPLFAVLTGYLKCGKKWSASYYRSLIPIVISWVLISGIHLLYKIFHLHQHLDAGEWIVQFLGFKLADYSWYVGMYVGLFLLSPLLNLAWDAVKTRKGHRAIVATFAVVSFIPATINGIGAICGIDQNLLPGYFTQVFYLGYYVIGCYIRTYRPRANRIACAVLIVFICAVHTLLNMFTRDVPSEFYTGYSASYSHPFIAILVVAVFLMLYDIECKKYPVRLMAYGISSVVLEMYLLSYLFDSNIYVLHRGEYGPASYSWVGLLMTLAVFVLSFVSGHIVHWISKTITKLFVK